MKLQIPVLSAPYGLKEDLNNFSGSYSHSFGTTISSSVNLAVNVLASGFSLLALFLPTVHRFTIGLS